MDKLIELLPLPSVLLNWPHPTNHVAIRDYARACVAHATTAKDAEIEALRPEEQVESKKKEVTYPHERYSDEWERAAERLAMAYCPGIKACRDCGAPCIDGHCCTFCGSANP